MMPPQDALVVGTYGQRMRLRLDDGAEVDARIKGRTLRPVCGDRVGAEPIDREADWLITSIRSRDNELTRPNMRGRTEVLAANLELLLVVTAGSPVPDWFVVDRYLSAAEDMRIEAAIVYNKTDLGAPDAVLGEYASIGYATARCSARSGAGIQEVRGLIGNRQSIIVGQSGVGKSSIINRLVGGAGLRTSAISGKSGEGRHTTVNSVMLALPGGGAVIDSPGVRDYAPSLQSASEVSSGFREIDRHKHDCRFANCRHLREPGCAVKAAVDAGTVSARRYASYKRLLALTEQLTAS
jgi:ribosome biogenesis GTPase / thiamine phosphate phosphatase